MRCIVKLHLWRLPGAASLLAVAVAAVCLAAVCLCAHFLFHYSVARITAVATFNVPKLSSLILSL